MNRAFTLLELMVAVALLAVIIVGLLAMFTQVQRAWKSGITQVDVMEGGRATMALIARDLQDMAALPQFNAVNFQAIDALNQAVYLDQPNGDQRANNLQDLSFVRRSGDDWTGVAYRITNAAWGVGSLYRLEGSLGSNPLTNYYSFPTNLSQLGRYIMGVSHGDPNFPVPLRPGESDRYYTNTGFARVLDGVVHFSVTAYDTNGTVMTNSIVNFNAQGFVSYSCVNLSTNGLLTAQILPSFVEVELAVVEPAVLERFNARIDQGPPLVITAATNYLARKSGQVHVFRQRVPIRPAATTVGPLLPGS